MDTAADAFFDEPDACVVLESRSSREQSGIVGETLIWRSWGSGDPVLLLHGGAGSWRQWARTIPALDGRYRLLVPDLPGYGDFDLPSAIAIGAIAKAFETGLDLSLTPNQSLRVVGFSLGAVVASRLAVSLQERVHRLVLVGANVVDDGGPRMQRLTNWRRANTEADRVGAIRKNLIATMLASDAAADEETIRIYANDLLRARLRANELSDVRPLRSEVPQLSDKTALSVICGRNDRVFAHVMDKQATALATLRPAPNSPRSKGPATG